MNGEDLEDVERVSYLDSALTVTRGAEEDVKSRFDEARVAINTVRPVWSAPSISTKNQNAHLHFKFKLRSPWIRNLESNTSSIEQSAKLC